MFHLRIAFFTLLAVFCVGCGPIPTITMGSLPAEYPRPMVAKKLDIPVYVVNETTNLPEEGSTKDEYPIPYTGLSTFINRDIKGALELYYSNVQAVSVAEVPTEGQGLIVSVRIDGLGYETQRITASNGVVAQTNNPYMQWALGMKGIGAEEYAYTFTAKSIGDKTFTSKSDVVAAFQTLLGDAVSDFLKSYIEKGVHQKLAEALAESGEDAPEEEEAAE